jgi:hypothetical protein
MTEAEWLAAADPLPMLEFVRGKVSDRKVRLFACACARQYLVHVTDVLSRSVVKLSERYADGQRSLRELQAARLAAPVVNVLSRLRARLPQDTAAVRAELEASELAHSTAAAAAWDVASAALACLRRSEHLGYRGADFAPYVRDIVGNPFRPTSLDPRLLEWNGRVAANLAEDAYQRHSFRRLPLVADTLEDAGCTDAALLGHLRGPGPHVRGCWALDLVLGKS